MRILPPAFGDAYWQSRPAPVHVEVRVYYLAWNGSAWALTYAVGVPESFRLGNEFAEIRILYDATIASKLSTKLLSFRVYETFSADGVTETIKSPLYFNTGRIEYVEGDYILLRGDPMPRAGATVIACWNWVRAASMSPFCP